MGFSTFPIFLKLEGKRCLVVGGDAAAARKVALLQRAGAEVTVAAHDLEPGLAALAAKGCVTQAAQFERALLDGMSLAIVAGVGEELARVVSDAAQAANVPVNAVDRPELSSFVSGALVERAPVTVAISTGGTAPALARDIRLAIERVLPPGLGRLARFAERFRAAVRAALPESETRRRFWDGFFKGPIAARVIAGDEAGARSAMLALVNGPEVARRAPGRIDILELASGEPDLLTLRAQRLMGEADVLLHDASVAAAILDSGRRDAERLVAAMEPGAAVEQAAGLARAGKRVVRLVDRDKARGESERRALAARGLETSLVPGAGSEIDSAWRAGAVNA